MAYFLSLFSPETHEKFGASSRTISGYRKRQQKAATERVQAGDKLICYLTRVSRWVGLFEVIGPAFEDSTPIFSAEDDPYVVRFKVKPIVWLDIERGIPIKDPAVWSRLEMTREHDPATPSWTGKVRTSLAQIAASDGRYLERLLLKQAAKGAKLYPLTPDEKKLIQVHYIQRPDGVVKVIVPEDGINDPPLESTEREIKESTRIQSRLAAIGAAMGMRVWIPKNDRNAVLQEWKAEPGELLEVLPLNYESTTLSTIERIDVLWIHRRSIVRAFEVEHTTSVYSGLLRMADLIALQPNMDIRLHIVAASERREKVMTEIQRPVFANLERAPLSKLCTFLDYEAVDAIAALPHLSHLSPKVLDGYAEKAE